MIKFILSTNIYLFRGIIYLCNLRLDQKQLALCLQTLINPNKEMILQDRFLCHHESRYKHNVSIETFRIMSSQ